MWRVTFGAARSVLPPGSLVFARSRGAIVVRVRMSRWAWLGLGAAHLIVGASTRHRVCDAVERWAGYRPTVEVQWNHNSTG